MDRGTPEHPFYAPEVGKYVSLRHLEVGARLHTLGGGTAVLVGKTWRQGGVEVFNLEVDGGHNFFAGGVLTHNAKKGGCGSNGGCTISPDWGVNRLVKELYRSGFTMAGASKSGGGFMFVDEMGDRVRIMPRPRRKPFRGESAAKFANRFYYLLLPDALHPQSDLKLRTDRGLVAAVESQAHATRTQSHQIHPRAA